MENKALAQLRPIIKHLLEKHYDRVFTHVLFNGRWEFYSRHEGSDASYVCIMGWRKSERDGGDIIYEARQYWNRVEETVGNFPDDPPYDDTFANCLRCMPAIERWLYVEDDSVSDDDDDDDEPEWDDNIDE